MKERSSSPYHFLSIAIPLMLLYGLMNWLTRTEKIKKATFFKVLNSLLLITFLITASLGLLLTAKLIYRFSLPYIKLIYIIHVDVGVAMAIISFFHRCVTGSTTKNY